MDDGLIIGVMAEDVREIVPDAVYERNGYLMVDLMKFFKFFTPELLAGFDPPWTLEQQLRWVRKGAEQVAMCEGATGTRIMAMGARAVTAVMALKHSQGELIP